MIAPCLPRTTCTSSAYRSRCCHPALQSVRAAPCLLRSRMTPQSCCRFLLRRGHAIVAGHVIDLTTMRSVAAEERRAEQIRDLQTELRARLGPAPAGAVLDTLAS